eukprot:4126267-Pyramimonas_sp.AAC.1
MANLFGDFWGVCLQWSLRSLLIARLTSPGILQRRQRSPASSLVPPSNYSLDIGVFVEVDIDAAATSYSWLSDHTPLTAHRRDRARRDEQGSIPEQ